MATRRERIVLDVEDNASLPIARVAAAAKLLDKTLKDVDGAHIKASQSTRQLGNDVDKTSTSFKRGESSLNQFTGRLATMARAAALVGPAVVPLTAGMIPALAGMTAGLTAAAGAMGVTILAANGLGDGLKALNAYQLEPTAANAVKLQQELEKLGPSGEHFVRYLDSLGPQLKSIQFAARDGLFPGVEEGIEALLQRLPQVRRIVSEIAETMGDLAGDAGAGLAGGGFDDFFNYLDNEAGPILRAFGETAGNVFETFANLIVGVDPLTQSFTDGMVRQSEALAEWSRGLADDEGFQSFIAYVRESGPQALEFMGQLVQAVAAIAQAAAPVGDVVLPILTQTLELIGAIAKSDFGTPIFATLAAMSALSTATRIWGSSGVTAARQFVQGQTAATAAAAKTQASLRNFTRYGGVFAGLAIAGSTLSDSFALSNTAALGMAGSLAGPWGAAVGAGVGLALDFAAANDTVSDALDRAEASLRSGNLTQANADLKDVNEQLAELEKNVSFDGSETPTSGDYWTKTFNPGALKNTIEGWFGDSDVEELKNRRDELLAVRDDLQLQLSGGLNIEGGGDGLRNLLAGPLEDATAAADDFTAAMARVNDVLTGRSDWRAYQQAIDDVRKSIKENGKTHDENTAKGRANTEALDRFAASAVKVGENIQNLDKKSNHLDRSRDQFIAMATAMGYSERRAERLATRLGLLDNDYSPTVNLDTSTAEQREKEIRQRLRQLGLSRADPRVGMVLGEFEKGDKRVLQILRALTGSKAIPKALLDDKQFQAIVAAVRKALKDVDRTTASPKVNLFKAQFDAGIGQVSSDLAALNGNSATTYVNVVRREFNSQSVAGRADGGTIYGQRQPYGDKVLAYLAPGEEVISNRFGQADRNRALLKAINANRMADGGTAGRRGDDNPARAGAQHIRELRAALRETVKALARMTRSLDANRDQLRAMREYRSQVGSSLAAELTGGGLAQFDLANAASRNDARAAARALKAARRKGLDGPLFDLVAASGDLALIQDFANLNAFQIQRREDAFRQTNQAQRQFGNLATTERFDRSIDRQEDIVAAQAATVRRLERREKRLEHSLERATERGSRRGTREGARGAGRDRTRRNGSRRRNRR